MRHLGEAWGAEGYRPGSLISPGKNGRQARGREEGP